MRVGYLFPCLLLFLLASCSTAPRQVQDSAPSNKPRLSDIVEATPQPVIRTKAGNHSPYRVFGQTYHVLADSKGYKERGLASWYGTKFHGNKTSNGEIYNMHAMTAAHKTLPIPSYVKVTHVKNGKSIFVRVNDRGPFVKGRIIDLSYAAARKLGVDREGVAEVVVEDVTPTTKVASNEKPSKPAVNNIDENAPMKFLQIGAYRIKQTALNLQQQVLSTLSHYLPSNNVEVVTGDDQLHRVHIGPITTLQQITDIRQVLNKYGFNGGIVIDKASRF